MRSRARAGWLQALACACCLICAGLAAALLTTSAWAVPDESEVQAALDKVQADPNLSPTRTIRTLKWDRERKPGQRSSVLKWIGGLFQWLAGVSRILLWLVIAALVAALVLFMARVLRNIGLAERSAALVVPTHVRELDIRPESLPDDIGATARSLWERGQHRAALALLYRGLLSRLVHVHNVPIRESSTEAECLRLALPRLGGDAASYATTLVRVWQHAVYGAKEPATDEVRALCATFDGAFPVFTRAAVEPS